MDGDHKLSDSGDLAKWVFRINQFVIGHKVIGVKAAPSGITLILENETTIEFQPDGDDVRVVLGWPKVPLESSTPTIQ